MLSMFSQSTPAATSLSSPMDSTRETKRAFTPLERLEARSSVSTNESDSLSVSSTIHQTLELEQNERRTKGSGSGSTKSDREGEELSHARSVLAWERDADESPLTDFKFLPEPVHEDELHNYFMSNAHNVGSTPGTQLPLQISTANSSTSNILNTVFAQQPLSKPHERVVAVDFTSFLEKLEKTQGGELTTLSQQMMVLIARHFHDSIQILKDNEANGGSSSREMSGSRVVCNIPESSKGNVRAFLTESEVVLEKRRDLAEALTGLFPSVLMPDLDLNLKHEAVERENFSFETAENDAQSLQFQLNAFRNGLSAVNSFHTLPSFYLQNNNNGLNLGNAQIGQNFTSAPNRQFLGNNLNDLQYDNNNQTPFFNPAMNGNASFSYAQNSLLGLNNLNYDGTGTNNNNNISSNLNFRTTNFGEEQDGRDNSLEEKIFGLRRKRKIKVSKDVSNFLLAESRKRQQFQLKPFKLNNGTAGVGSNRSLEDDEDALELGEDGKQLKKKGTKPGKQRGRPRKVKANSSSVSNSMFSLSGSLTSNQNHNNSNVNLTNSINLDKSILTNNLVNNIVLNNLNLSQTEPLIHNSHNVQIPENGWFQNGTNNSTVPNSNSNSTNVNVNALLSQTAQKLFHSQLQANFSSNNLNLIVPVHPVTTTKRSAASLSLKTKSTVVERSKEEVDLISLGLPAIEEKIAVLQQSVRSVKHRHRKGTVCPSCTYEQKLRLCIKAKVKIIENMKLAPQNQ